MEERDLCKGRVGDPCWRGLPGMGLLWLRDEQEHWGCPSGTREWSLRPPFGSLALGIQRQGLCCLLWGIIFDMLNAKTEK